MIKNAIILHGISDSPTSYWLPYIKESLEKKGFNVWAPQLPQKDEPKLDIQVPFILKNATLNEETIMIGHSSAVGLIFGVLEQIKTPVKRVICVSGFIDAEHPREPTKGIIKDFDWESIKKHAKEFIFINSDNDPWGATDIQGRKMFDHLGGTLIIKHGEGHMGSNLYNQPYKEFPLLLSLITLKIL